MKEVVSKNRLKQILILIKQLRNVSLFSNGLHSSFPFVTISNNINNNGTHEKSKFVYDSNVLGIIFNDKKINLFNTNYYNLNIFD